MIVDSEFEVEAELKGKRLKLHFHARCYTAWKALLGPMLEPDPRA